MDLWKGYPVGGGGQYGASLAQSASSGATGNTGAVSANSSGLFLGNGPGSAIFNSGAGGGLSISTPVLIGLIVAAGIVLVIALKR